MTTVNSSNMLRITGMATGMDTDTTVKQLMKSYQTKLDKMLQNKQIVQWKQDLYRDILSDWSTFTSSFLDISKPENYMLTKNAYAGFDVAVTSSDATKSAGVSVTAGAGAVAGNYAVVVNQLAGGASFEGSSLNESAAVVAPATFDPTKWEGNTITFTVGTTDVVLNLAGVRTDNKTNFLTDVNSKITASSLDGKLTVSDASNGGVKFNVLTSDSVKIKATTIAGELDNLVGKIINPKKDSTTLDSFGIGDNTKFTLDYTDSTGTLVAGKEINITDASAMDIQDLINLVTTTTSGNIKLNFSELSGKFTMQTLKTGSAVSLSIDDSNSVLSKIGITAGSASGQDSKITITPPGAGAVATMVVKDTNNFTIDNITYNLTKADAALTNNVNITSNPQKTFDKIKSFLDKYNELIDKLNTKIEEKKLYSYTPLTDDQKSEMKESDITKWEEKAKQGLLKNDSLLQGMVSSMRNAFYREVEGAGITLSEIGLSTSADVSQRGKIIYDETKLKNAIANNGEQVANLFIKVSAKEPSYNPSMNASDRDNRYSDEGIFQRINDILKDYTRTTMRDNNGKKGLLIEKAGVKGDFADMLSKDMAEKEKRISEWEKKMYEKENAYYLQFAKLEQAMNNMNSQSSWLTQQLGG